MRGMRYLGLALGVGMIALLSAEAGEPPPFLVAYRSDTAYILVTEIPRYCEGFDIYREVGGNWKKLNEKLVVPVRDPLMFRTALEDDYYWVKKALKAEDEVQVARRLLGDPGVGFAFSLASLNVAGATGRLFIDAGVKRGRQRYRIIFRDLRGKEMGKIEEKVKLQEMLPEPPDKPELKEGDGYVRIKWDYPPHSGRPEEATVTFNIYRKARGEKEFIRINKVPVMRQKGGMIREDRKVENGIEYTYYIKARDFTGREGPPSPKAKAVPRDLTPPLIPEGLKAEGEEGRIVLTWNMNVDLDLSHYYVLRSTEPSENFVRINKKPVPGDKPRYVDSDVKYGIQYFYKVVAVDKSGNESKPSGAVAARSKNLTPPPPPGDVRYEFEGRKVRLTWKKPDDEGLLGYRIYRGKSPEKAMLIVGEPIPPDTLYYLDLGYRRKGLAPGRTYFYAVTAIDQARNESEKKFLSVKIPDDVPPEPPLSVDTKALADGTIKIRWGVSASPDVAFYRIYRKIKDGKPSQIGEVSAASYEFVDSSVEKGRSYYYAVSAVDSAGNESCRTDFIAEFARDFAPPPPPAGVKITVTEKGVEIRWEKVSVDDLLGYNVYRSDLPTGVFERLNDRPLRAEKFIDREGRKGLYYRITSLDTSGNESKRARAYRAR
ncbi:MAG: hypothetical protein J7K11_08755 [Candidatus Hydrothermae bacterium]|nr:hypothetical protein [Candidatus Hydrothermae bacterium]